MGITNVSLMEDNIMESKIIFIQYQWVKNTCSHMLFLLKKEKWELLIYFYTVA